MNDRVTSPFGRVFGGFFDICHWERIGVQQELQLRLSALFCDEIIAPDTFFHCRGPLFKHIQSVGSEFPSEDKVRSDLILSLLREGVLLPAVRETGRSLAQNYGTLGISAGNYTFPPMEEAQPVLKIIDSLLAGKACKVTWHKHDSLRTFDALDSAYCTPTIDEVRADVAARARVTKREGKSWHPVLQAFRDAVQAQRGREFFRRGDVENPMADSIGIKDRSQVYRRYADIRPNFATPAERVFHFLMSEMLVYYQAGQGTALADVGAVSAVLKGHKFNRESMRLALREPVGHTTSGWMVYREQLVTEELLDLDTPTIMELRRTYMSDYRLRMDDAARGCADDESRTRAYRRVSAKFRDEIAKKLKADSRSKTLRALSAVLGIAVPAGKAAYGDFASAAVAIALGAAANNAADKREAARARVISDKLGDDLINFVRSNPVRSPNHGT